MEQVFNRYISSTPMAMFNFQFIEEGLKMYLSICSKCEKNYEELKDIPLGPLRKLFCKVNNNKVLQNEILILKDERNAIIHRCFLITMEETENMKLIKDKLEHLQEVSAGSKQCFEQIILEIKQLKKATS